ncbi:hypothetical protein [Rhizobium sp. Root1220]|uniref:hypothetical protein n=1 Tax=Rhizobium sp. Root1220 TaxID=1736432 RepID=UPI0006F25026|nr:hypothetical protein [Rhizobium sp. Root1220]KQV70325.1 hypothetical protein ASC90_09435 [Rhizobium sp. Root1220]
MSIEPIGIFTVALGLVCLALGYRAAATVFIVMALFGSAAAILAGSANVQPAHLFLLFLAIAAVQSGARRTVVLKTLSFGQPGFWLACLVVYGAVTAYFSPRLFAGITQIIPLGVSEYPSSGGTVPLGPVSSNLTQTIYLVADLVCFLLIVAVGSSRSGFQAIVNGLIAYAAFNVVFALLDLATNATGTSDTLQFMRNAQYTFHDNDTVNGMKRIVGSWPEASAFAGTTLGAFGFTATLWLCSRRLNWTGPLSLASLMLIIMSTSSTGLVAAPICLVVLYATALVRSGVDRGSRHSTAVVLLAPPLVVAAALIVLLYQDLYNLVHDYVDLLVLSKSGSASGMERGSWNTYGLGNFVDSWGLGVGLGTARTSSFPVALLSNVGIPGMMFFLLFAFAALGSRRDARRTYEADVALAARNGCLCLLVGAMLAGATVDLGLLFFIFAGLASCRTASAEEIMVPAVPLRGRPSEA